MRRLVLAVLVALAAAAPPERAVLNGGITIRNLGHQRPSSERRGRPPCAPGLHLR